MALIHKTKKEEGKKHKTKKKTQKKQQILGIKLRNDRFKLFWHDLRPISTCFNRFDRRPIRPNLANTARFWPNQPSLVRIEAESARFSENRSRVYANPREKNAQTRHRHTGSCVGRRTPRRATPDSSATPFQPRRCFKDLYSYFAIPHQNRDLLRDLSNGERILVAYFYSYFATILSFLFFSAKTPFWSLYF